MKYSTTTWAVLGLAALSSGHMIMNTPIPYGRSTLNNSPLLPDGSDFPCKQRSGVYAAEGASNTMPLGSSQKLAFIGSATHGGGSCQVSITYDPNPSKSSVFKVIHSIEGGCPIRNVAGNHGDNAEAINPDTYSFTIPTTLPTGSATLAWTWFNKIGNREMYMNCAPISITGGTSKRTADMVRRDTAAFDALPDMFVANIGNGCGTVDSTDVLFPNPGDSVAKEGQATASALSTPTGSCAQAVAPAPSVAAGGSSAAPSQAPQSTAAPASSSLSIVNVSGGVYATVATPSAASAAPTPSTAPADPAPSVVTMTPSVPAPGPAPSAAPTNPPPAASSVPAPSTGKPTAASSGAQSGFCTSEGIYNCIDGTSFQRCGSGFWSVVQPVAPGTICNSGQSMDMHIARANVVKRAVHFTG